MKSIFQGLASVILAASALMANGWAASAITQTSHLEGNDWLIATDAQNKGVDEKWFATPRPEAKQAAVPSVLQEQFPNYYGLVWYWKTFEAPRNPDPNGRYLLRFWSVDYKADVWVNGKSVGTHRGADAPFILDVTDAIHPGTGNLLAVRVLNPTNERIDGIVLNETARGAKVLPHFPGMEWNFGGILDSVELLAAPAVYIEDLHVMPDWKTGEIKVEASVQNTGKTPVATELGLNVAPANGGETADEATFEATAPVGPSVLTGHLRVPQYRLWDLDDPFLYSVSARLQAKDSPAADEQSVRCGFRQLDFADGYFRLNGRRIFINSAHSLWTTPIRIHSSDDLAMLRRDMIYAKTMGFNTIRFLPFAGARRELDLCDELGLMVMQQSAQSWELGSSSRNPVGGEMPAPAKGSVWDMPTEFDRPLLSIVQRDRNHPCIVLWYFLNETNDGPVFRHAVETLPKVRALDESRICLLSSARWDQDWSIGSLSRPGSNTWDVKDLADDHTYLEVPHRTPEIGALRNTLAHKPWKGPILFSEYGIASAIDLVGFTRYYERMGATDKMDAQYYRELLDKFMRDWDGWRLDEVFGRPEDYFRACLAANAPQRRLGMNSIRANPQVVGYSMTALHDEVSCGEGPITFLRDLKPGEVDAIRDGFAPLKWCLFVNPWNIYRGGVVHAEAVLANEDALRPGDYQVEIAIFGPDQQVVLREPVTLHVPDPKTNPPFVMPVWSKNVKIDGPGGRYRLTATFVSGASAVDSVAEFQVTDSPQVMSAVPTEVVLLGDDTELESWLNDKARIHAHSFSPDEPTRKEVILVSGKQMPDLRTLQDLSRRVEQGASLIYLRPPVMPVAGPTSANNPGSDDMQAWKQAAAKLHWVDAKNVGRLDVVAGFYHRDDWARRHPIFDGLPCGGLMDWRIYQNIVPQGGFSFKNIEKPDEAVCGGIQTSLGYDSGLYVAVYRNGAGRVILNALNIRENIGKDPVAEILLRNMLNYAAGDPDKPVTNLPSLGK